MKQPNSQFIHSDKYRGSVNFTLIFALFVIAYGLLQGESGQTLVIVGALVAVYVWFTRAREIEIYEDCILIRYGKPRVKIIPFENIERVDPLHLQVPDRWRIHLYRGRRIVLLTRDPELFVEKLEEAREAYSGKIQD
ncbi:MAG: hypothetical protein ACJ0KI_06770 [Dehalococcoidia bacterium]|tara:strand:- start:42 stop:452 length:411 start_codon:yes stop_codon:yes gene_type:complete